MKSVLISIQPKWCELIARGKKTIEVRKTAPKLQTPFECYIYATKPKKFIKGYADDDLFRHVDGRIECGFSFQLALEEGATPENNVLSGKVIGEFVCDDIDKIAVFNNYLYCVKNTQPNKLSQMCLTIDEVIEYLVEKNRGYNWHISNLKIYDKPKELGEFSYPCKKGKADFNADTNCKGCKYAFKAVTSDRIYCDRIVTRPPQSWCYVEG